MTFTYSVIVEPRFEVPESVVVARTMRALVERLYDTFTVYSADTVAAGRSDVSSYCRDLRNSGTVVSLPPVTGRSLAYPAFQFDENVRVLTVVAEVNKILDAKTEPIAAASWWATPNAQLGGRAPHEIIDGVDPDAELVAVALMQSRIDG